MNMTNAAAAALIIGALLPFLVTFCKQDGWPKWANEIVTILACGAAGTLTVWATHGFAHFQVGNLLVVIAAVFVASQAAYAAYWKGTGTEAKLNRKSSFAKSPATTCAPLAKG